MSQRLSLIAPGLLRRWLIACVVHLIFVAAFFWWTGIGDDTTVKLALSAGAAVFWVAALAWFERWLFSGSRLGGSSFAIRLLGLVGVAALGWYATHWVPKVSGLALQSASFLLRWSGAWLLLNAAWLNLGVWGQAGAPVVEDGLPAEPGQ
jgi:hypothetical protein